MVLFSLLYTCGEGNSFLGTSKRFMEKMAASQKSAVLDVRFVYFLREDGNTGNFSIVPYTRDKVIAYLKQSIKTIFEVS